MKSSFVSSLAFVILSVCLKLGDGQTYLEDLTITEEQKKLLDKFKEKMLPRLKHEYMKSDIYLIRWLRHGFYDISKAVELLNANLAWRENNDMDRIHEEDWSYYKKHYKYSMKGRDREGKPLVFLNTAEWDVRKAAVSGNSERYMRYIDKIFDEASILIRELGDKYKNVTQTMLIANLRGFNLVQHGCLNCLPVYLRVIQTYETHYPGYAHKFILVNVPAVAEPILRVLRGAFHPVTTKALHFYGTNRQVWWNELKKDFTLDQIPQILGGGLNVEEDEDYNDAF